jgi:ComF family protein
VSAAQKVSSGLFALVFPDTCRICDSPLSEVSRVPVCRRCLSEPEPLSAEYLCINCHAPFVTPHPLDAEGRCGLCRRGLTGFDSAYAFGIYDGTLRRLIQLFKYGNVPTLAGPLSLLLSLAAPRERAFDAIVPMPMHWRRRWQRGFNQSELLARGLGRRMNLPVESLVRRRKSTPPQAGLTGAQRRTNVSGAFAVRRAEAVGGKRILLIDDVLTTGATAGACASVLKRAGAAHVAVLTVARADRRSSDADAAQMSFQKSATPSGSVRDAKSGSTT